MCLNFKGPQIYQVPLEFHTHGCPCYHRPRQPPILHRPRYFLRRLMLRARSNFPCAAYSVASSPAAAMPKEVCVSTFPSSRLRIIASGQARNTQGDPCRHARGEAKRIIHPNSCSSSSQAKHRQYVRSPHPQDCSSWSRRRRRKCR